MTTLNGQPREHSRSDYEPALLDVPAWELEELDAPEGDAEVSVEFHKLGCSVVETKATALYRSADGLTCTNCGGKSRRLQ